MKKRFPAIILALALCVGLAVPAFAADGDFTIQDGVLTKYNGSGGAVTIPSGVTEIGAGVFDNCSSLTSVTIPDGVTTIGNLAFFGCQSLASVTIPDSVTKIDGGAFGVCTSLTSITIPDGVTTIRSSTFFGCTGLTSVTIPSSVTSIGKQAFENCTSLTSVTIPSSVTAIENGAFKGCTSLTICGYESSAAQHHAEENNIPFDSLGAAPAPAAPEFTDVEEDAYYEDAVKWAVAHEPVITNGTTDTTFEPGITCTQVQILTFLYRAAGEPESEAELPVDIEGKNVDYAKGALCWAAEKGMIDETFDVAAPCTRASAVNYIWQAFGKLEADKSEFKDVDAEAAYAAAVDWAVANGITNGTDKEAGQFSPEGTCTRGEIVTFLHRAYVEEARLTVEK